MCNLPAEREAYGIVILNKHIGEIQKINICLFTGTIKNGLSAAAVQGGVREFVDDCKLLLWLSVLALYCISFTSSFKYFRCLPYRLSFTHVLAKY